MEKNIETKAPEVGEKKKRPVGLTIFSIIAFLAAAAVVLLHQVAMVGARMDGWDPNMTDLAKFYLVIFFVVAGLLAAGLGARWGKKWGWYVSTSLLGAISWLHALGMIRSGESRGAFMQVFFILPLLYFFKGNARSYLGFGERPWYIPLLHFAVFMAIFIALIFGLEMAERPSVDPGFNF